MIYKTVYKRDNKTLIKLSGLADGDEKGTWASCSIAVYNYAKKTFKDGDEVDAEYSIKDGEYNVTRVTAKGKSSVKSDKPICIDCGKELKDSKYEKCYTCNKKNPSKKTKTTSTKGSSFGNPTDEEATRRNKLATLSSVCEAINVMTGQVGDVDTLGEMIVTLYDKLYKKLFG